MSVANYISALKLDLEEFRNSFSKNCDLGSGLFSSGAGSKTGAIDAVGITVRADLDLNPIQVWITFWEQTID